MDTVGLYAVRRLSVDIANLTGQLAVAQATMEVLDELARQLTPEAWERQPIKPTEGEPLREPSEMYTVELSGGQAEVVRQILVLIRGMQ